MNNSLCSPFRRYLFAVALALAPLMAGCKEEAEIRSYTVAKELPPDRMLGAILPAGERAWFFKVAGPAADMDTNAAAIEEFFTSIRVTPGAAKLDWKLPPTWREEAGSEMRAATIMIPADGKPLELSVIPLPSQGGPGEVLSNVNRWRAQQMALPAVDERGLAESTREIKVGDATMTLVDLRGTYSGGMTAPFAGGGPFSGGPPRADGVAPRGPQIDSSTASDAGSSDLPAGHPPVDADRAADAVPLTFDTPDSWEQVPASGMRRAAFRVAQGHRRAEATVFDFRASAPKMADPLENVNRWRREIGLAPINQAELDASVQEIEVGGTAGQYAEMIPGTAGSVEAQAGKATLAAIVPAGELVWFFKLSGDRELVASQRENFKSFLESVRFTSTDGARDGD